MSRVVYIEKKKKKKKRGGQRDPQRERRGGGRHGQNTPPKLLTAAGHINPAYKKKICTMGPLYGPLLQNYEPINPFRKNCRSFETWISLLPIKVIVKHRSRRRSSALCLALLEHIDSRFLTHNTRKAGQYSFFFFFEDHVPYFILFFCDVHVQLLHQHFGGHPSGGLVSHFLRFLQTGFYHPVYMLVFWFWPILWILQMLRMSSSRILSRRVSPVMHFKVLKRESSSSSSSSYRTMFCFLCLFSRTVDVQLSHPRFGDHSDSFVFNFPFYVMFADHPVCMFSPSSRLLILAHLTTSRISQMLQISLSRILSRRLLPMMHLKVHYR